jgi:hypothetical protein
MAHGWTVGLQSQKPAVWLQPTALQMSPNPARILFSRIEISPFEPGPARPARRGATSG